MGRRSICTGVHHSINRLVEMWRSTIHIEFEVSFVDVLWRVLNVLVEFLCNKACITLTNLLNFSIIIQQFVQLLMNSTLQKNL